MLFRAHEPDCYASFSMCGMLAVCKAPCLLAVCVHPAWHDACRRAHFLSLQQWDNSMDDYADLDVIRVWGQACWMLDS